MADGSDAAQTMNQAGRRKAVVKVTVAGEDMTAKWEPHLISVVAIDKATDPPEADTCSIELDDRDATLTIPVIGDPVTAEFGWINEGSFFVFNGVVSEVESGFARAGGGRRLWVDATGPDYAGMGKTNTFQSWGEGLPPGGGGQDIPLQQVLAEAGSLAGYRMLVDPSLGALTRKYWHQQEGFHHFVARIASEVGGIAKLGADQGVLINGKGGFGGMGISMGSVEAVWGENLIAWRIKPFLASPQYKQAVSEFYDRLVGGWGKKFLGIGGATPFGKATADTQPQTPQPGPNEGEQINDGQDASSERDRTAGWCLINGEPQALAAKTMLISGARPGVDGPYMISEAEHHYSRDGGYITRCVLLNFGTPGGGDFQAPSTRGYENWDQAK